MRAPVCISPSNRSNRSASASVTERDKRLAEKSVEKPVANRAQGLTHFFAVVAGRWCASEPGNGLRATVDRPRAVCSAVVSRVDAAGARSRTCNNLLSLNRVYNYGMISVTCSRPFSELGDQQLLEQTRRLAANQRGIDVHILDHLDEIDRRGLALRRGFSSLFDYAVRELRFTDAAAQRRIQAMRLCRRHGWVRACLQSGELSMTAAGQLETTFAGAERAERQSHTGHRNVGQGRGRDQDHDCASGTRQLGLPAAPGEADEQGERGHRSAPGFAPPAGECSGDARERGHRSAPGGAPAGECGREHARGAGGEPRWCAGPRRRACRRATAAAGVERKRVAVSGALLRSRCCSRCRCRHRRAVIGRGPCSTTSAADEFLGVDARAGHGSSGVAAHRFARAGTTPG